MRMLLIQAFVHQVSAGFKMISIPNFRETIFGDIETK